jgi:hypothetical protein
MIQKKTIEPGFASKKDKASGPSPDFDSKSTRDQEFAYQTAQK